MLWLQGWEENHPQRASVNASDRELVFSGPKAIKDFWYGVCPQSLFVRHVSYSQTLLLKWHLIKFRHERMKNVLCRNRRIWRQVRGFSQFPSYAFKFYPKAFSLTELSKGYFSHLLNTPENQRYYVPLMYVLSLTSTTMGLTTWSERLISRAMRDLMIATSVIHP